MVYLVQAKSLARALRYIDEVMGKTMIDYDTIGINETPIMDVFEHQVASEKKRRRMMFLNTNRRISKWNMT